MLQAELHGRSPALWSRFMRRAPRGQQSRSAQFGGFVTRFTQTCGGFQIPYGVSNILTIPPLGLASTNHTRIARPIVDQRVKKFDAVSLVWVSAKLSERRKV
jgi:hypothetical protein